MDSLFKGLEQTKLTVPQGYSVSTISKSPMNYEPQKTPYGCFLGCIGREARLEGGHRLISNLNTSFGELAEFDGKQETTPNKSDLQIIDNLPQKLGIEMQELDDSSDDLSSEESNSESTSEMLEYEAPAVQEKCESGDSSIDEYDADQDLVFQAKEAQREVSSGNMFSCENGQVGHLEINEKRPKQGGVYVTDVLVEDADIGPLEAQVLASNYSSVEEAELFDDLGVSSLAQSTCLMPQRKGSLCHKEQSLPCEKCSNTLTIPEKSGSTIATKVTASSMYPRFVSLARGCKCHLRRTRSVKRVAALKWPMKDILITIKAIKDGKKKKQYGSLEF